MNPVEAYFRRYLTAYKPYKDGLWCYEDGCALRGAQLLYEATGDEWYLTRLRQLAEARIGPDGAVHHYDRAEFNLDNLMPGRVMTFLGRVTGDPRYERAAATLAGQFAEHPRTKIGSFWHKAIYPSQIWLDGAYMALPFLLERAAATQNQTGIEDAARQMENIAALLRDPVTGLYFHGYDESRSMDWADRRTGLSATFWSRSIGWLAMAIADMIELLPLGHKSRAALAGQLLDLAGALLSRQLPDGLWPQVPDRPVADGNYPEVSASAMFAYALQKGARLGILGGRHGERGRAALAGIEAGYLKPGPDGSTALGGICLMAGLGGTGYARARDGSYAYYIGEPIVADDPKGVGPFMMAWAERRRHQASAGAPAGDKRVASSSA